MGEIPEIWRRFWEAAHDRDLSGQHPPGQADQAVDVEAGGTWTDSRKIREPVQGVGGCRLSRRTEKRNLPIVDQTSSTEPVR